MVFDTLPYSYSYSSYWREAIHRRKIMIHRPNNLSLFRFTQSSPARQSHLWSFRLSSFYFAAPQVGSFCIFHFTLCSTSSSMLQQPKWALEESAHEEATTLGWPCSPLPPFTPLQSFSPTTAWVRWNDGKLHYHVQRPCNVRFKRFTNYVKCKNVACDYDPK